MTRRADKTEWRMLRWWWRSLFRASPAMAGGLLTALLIGGATKGLEVLAIQAILNSLLEKGLTAWNVGGALGFLVGIMAAGHVFTTLQSLLKAKLVYHTSVTYRELILEKASDVPLEFHENPEFHDRLSRAQSAIDAFLALLDNSNELVRQATAFLSYIAYACSVHWSLPIAFATALLPAFVARAVAGTHYTELLREQTPETRKLSYLGELLTGRAAANEVWVFGLRRHLLQRWQALSQKLLRQRLARVGKYQVLLFGLNFGSIGATLWGFTVTLSAALRGAVSIGALVGGLETLYRTGSQGQHMVMSFGKLQEGLLSLEHLHQFLNQDQPAPRAETATGEYVITGPIEAVRFENVSFSYPGGREPVLRNISVTFRPGDRVALVGPNGAGKSSLAALLLGLYAPTEGRILVNGIDRTLLGRKDWWKQCSAVYQDFERYEFSLRDNLLTDCADAEIARVIAQAGLDQVAASLKNGLDTTLGRLWDGQELSLGQWQAVAIARALVHSTPVTVMDEPTSALDPRAEVRVYQQMMSCVRPDSILVMISHRMGMCRLADRVLVLQEGRLVEEGTHEELYDKNGPYRSLFRAQAEWYN